MDNCLTHPHFYPQKICVSSTFSPHKYSKLLIFYRPLISILQQILQ
ncbi:hypothetical protein A0O32_0802 [Anoxybacillus flavithermus]|nr:hypothetical protein A0O32_0802 [Anoxybacillus flavithermus]